MDFLSAGWWQLLLAFGIPAAVLGVLIRRLEKRIEKREKHRDELEAQRTKLDLILLESCSASIALGEATARAVQRIPDAHCNGDMHDALDYATLVKHRQKDFVTSLGVNALHDNI